MPSPIAHAAMGYVVYRVFRSRMPRMSKEVPRYAGLLTQRSIATVAVSLVPDLDSVPGILLGDLGRFHNDFTHSLVFGLPVALGVGTAVWIKQRSGFKRWIAITIVGYELHVVMDLFTAGRGVMLAWPFSSDRIEPPVKLFYGVRWSQGVMTPHHLVTLATELGVVGFLGLAMRLLTGRKPAGAAVE